MSTKKVDIARWIEEGLEKGATHLIVVVDTFDYEDFPVYVMPGQNAQQVVNQESGKSMQRIMEVYNLSMDLNQQLNQRRAYNI